MNIFAAFRSFSILRTYDVSAVLDEDINWFYLMRGRPLTRFPIMSTPINFRVST
jgi:hypothetical protein